MKELRRKLVKGFSFCALALVLCACLKSSSMHATGKVCFASTSSSDTITANLESNETGEELVNKILGTNLSATDITKVGTVYSFSNGKSEVGIDSGIILDTSGKISSNVKDTDLLSIMDYSYGGDTASLEFTMTATGNLLNFNYVFASTEFDQPVKFNDIFGLFVSVNGSAYENIAKIARNDGTEVPVCISSLKGGLSGNELTGKPVSGTKYSLFTAKNISLETNGVSNVFNAQKAVSVGDTVKIKFVIADVSDKIKNSYVMIESSSLSFEPPSVKVNYKYEVLQGLESNASYKIICDGQEYTFTSDDNREIALAGTDETGNIYDFIGKTIEITKVGNSSAQNSVAKTLEIATRPVAPDEISGPTGTPSDIYEKDIEVTEAEIKVAAKSGQEYSLDKEDWKEADASGYVIFGGLTANTEYTVYTRYTATESQLASNITNGTSVITKNMARNLTYNIYNYDGIYDAEEHYSYVNSLDDATVRYSSTLEGTYKSNFIKFKDVGTYTVYYMITKDDYYPAYGALTVNITPKEITPKVELEKVTYTFDGQAKTPKITLKNGEDVIPEEYYEVIYENNVNVGTADIRVKSKDGANYLFDVSSHFEIKVEEGTIKKIIKDFNAACGTLLDSADELKSKIPLTDAEKTLKENGKNISVFLEVEDITSRVSENDKKLILDEIDENDEVGLYLDVNLYKQVDGEEKVKVSETDEKVTISFEIPESLMEAKDGKEFYIMRIHNGVVSLPDVTVEGNILTFETDEFSTYVLAYKTKEKSASSVVKNESKKGSSESKESRTSKESKKTSNPETGDNVKSYEIALIISFLGFIGIVKLKKK